MEASPAPNKVSSFLGLGTAVIISLAGSSLALYFANRPILLDAHSAPNEEPDTTELPCFSLAEIRKHNGSSGSPWVTRGNKVYDITDWISAHPGGDVILRAAGGSIDPYWDIFSIHKSQYVYDILESYLIGQVDDADISPDGSKLVGEQAIADPFSDDPERHADLKTLTLKPRNAESPAYALEDSFLTPNDLFYVRNHMWVPTVEGEVDDYSLSIELADGSTKSYTLRDLKTRFPKSSVTAILQCSGNRRSHMSKETGRKANGLPWQVGAISNAVWEGVRLADVLADAGFDPHGSEEDRDVRHVHFAGSEAYASSIPIRKAMDPYGDVLLAWGMNGEPLPPDHGFPLRSIVPGTVAARSVKWLNRIALSDEESPSQWQRKDYKCFGPNQTTVDWATAPSIQEMPVQSAITAARLHNAQKDDTNSSDSHPISVSGYAFSGGGHAIVRVDISLDDGKSWTQARLLDNNGSGPDDTANQITQEQGRTWSWKLWRFDGAVPDEAFRPQDDGADKKCTRLLVKAVDDAYNTQPESYAANWNLRGNLCSSWHRVLVCTDCIGKS